MTITDLPFECFVELQIGNVYVSITVSRLHKDLSRSLIKTFCLAVCQITTHNTQHLSYTNYHKINYWTHTKFSTCYVTVLVTQNVHQTGLHLSVPQWNCEAD